MLAKAAAASLNCETSIPTSRTKAWRPRLSSTATPPRGWAFSRNAIDAALYHAFGQRQVSTMYKQLNQYHVVMEVAPEFPANAGRAAEHLRACQVRNHGPAARPSPLRALQHALGGESSGAISVGDAVLQSCAKAFLWARPRNRSKKRNRDHESSGHHPRQLPGNGAAFQDFARQRTVSDPGRAGYGVHRSGHSLRKLHSSHHHSFHAAFRRRGRAPGAVC